ncbi:MAG: TonB-dependent receptor plug domain-containing protein [Bacteroidales bacterium]|nr:TonB-dependent receptor plug domain-containing protein [Bacteroidales bacterium]
MQRLVLYIGIIGVLLLPSTGLSAQTDLSEPQQLDSSVVQAKVNAPSRGNLYLYNPKRAFNTISVIGEPDVLRHITSLPGVSTGVEGTLGMFVRGAGNGSNRTDFNGVPMTSTSHLLGMLSSFSPEIIESAEFRPGGISAEHGDLSSSIVSIQARNHPGQGFDSKLTLSPYLAGLALSGSAGNRFGYSVAARGSALPYIGKKVMYDYSEGYSQMDGQVYDMTALVAWVSPWGDQVDAMYYRSRDYYAFSQGAVGLSLGWEQDAWKVGWRRQFFENLEIAAQVYGTGFSAVQGQDDRHRMTGEVLTHMEVSNAKHEQGVNLSGRYAVGTGALLVGVQSVSDAFSPSNVKGEWSGVQHLSSRIRSFFVQYEGSLGGTELLGGLRAVRFSSKGYSSTDADVHFKADIPLSRRLGLEITADRMTQYHHTIEGMATGWSVDVMIPAMSALPQERTHSAYAGLFYVRNTDPVSIHLTGGVYFRDMRNLVSYIRATDTFGMFGLSWDLSTDRGSGTSYGGEFSAEVDWNRLGATLAYTLSRTDRVFPQINGGVPFPSKFDRRHVLDFQGRFQTVRRPRHQEYLNLAVAWYSGSRATVTVSYYEGYQMPFHYIESTIPSAMMRNALYRQEMTAVNGFRLPDYFRLDVAYTFVFHGRRLDHELAVSVFNATNRHNPYMVFNQDGKWKSLSLLPVMPSLRYTMDF